MRIPGNMWMTWIAAAFGALLMACASTQPPAELEQARAEYEQLEDSEAADSSPAAVEEAEEALEQAEDAFDEHGDSEVTRQQAEAALRKIRMARQSADMARGMEPGMEPGEELEQGARTGAMEQERTQRIQAERDLAQVRQQLRDVADVHRDERGLVLWFGEDLFQGKQKDLSASAKDHVNQVANALRTMQDRDIKVVAYTGQDTKNRDLWNKRAEAVKTQLTQQGFSEDRVQAEVKTKAAPSMKQGKMMQGKMQGKMHEEMHEGEKMQEGEKMHEGSARTEGTDVQKARTGEEATSERSQARTGIAIIVQEMQGPQREGTPSYERGTERQEMKEREESEEKGQQKDWQQGEEQDEDY